MNTVRFGDVLWAIARKAGFSPESGNLLSNQAIPLGEYASQWVDRLYDAEDWPEWTKLLRATPDLNNIVSYNPPAPSLVGSDVVHIRRVISVYPVDPTTVETPVSLDFTLRDQGIDCGLDHGIEVWIKYIALAPRFSAEPWVSDVTYSLDDVVYSGTTKECYRSRVNNNIGHDPATGSSPPPHDVTEPPTVATPPPVPTHLVQSLAPASFGAVAQSKIIQIDISHSGGLTIPSVPALSAVFRVPVMNSSNTILANASHVCATGTETLDVILTDLANQLISGLGAGWTVTTDTTNMLLTISNASDFRVVNSVGSSDFPRVYLNSFDKAHLLDNKQLQAYVAAVSGGGVTPQIVQVSFSTQHLIAGALYTVSFKDSTGGIHQVLYQSVSSDGQEDILTGILNAVQGASASAQDPFLTSLKSSLDLSARQLSFAANSDFSVDVTLVPGVSAWWEYVPFPAALFNQVVRGASADYLKEKGQADKGAQEEQNVQFEETQAKGSFDPAQTAMLTTQAGPISRYRIKK